MFAHTGATSNITDVINFTCPLFETHLFHGPLYQDTKIFLLVMISINALMALIASCSNALVVCTISKTPSLQTPSNILILGLAISDFCFGVFVQPTYCVFRFAEYSRNLDLFCYCSKVYLLSCVMLLAISIATLTSITADRFLAVHLHLRYQELVTTRRYGIVIAIIWILGISMNVLSWHSSSPTLFTVFIVIFTLLFSMNAFFIWKVFKVIHRHSGQIQVQQSATNAMKRRRKSVNMMYCMIGAFLLCYIPYVGVSINFRVENRMTQVTRNAVIVTETLFMFNGVLNPIIYCWRMDEMRQAALQLLQKLRRRKEGLSVPQNA